MVKFLNWFLMNFHLTQNYLSASLSFELRSVLEQHAFNADVTKANTYLPTRPYIRQTRLMVFILRWVVSKQTIKIRVNFFYGIIFVDKWSWNLRIFSVPFREPLIYIFWKFDLLWDSDSVMFRGNRWHGSILTLVDRQPNAGFIFIWPWNFN